MSKVKIPSAIKSKYANIKRMQSRIEQLNQELKACNEFLAQYANSN